MNRKVVSHPGFLRGQTVSVWYEGREQEGTIVGLQYQDWADEPVLLIVVKNDKTIRVEQERVIAILREPTTGE